MDKWDETFNKHEVIKKYPEEDGVIKAIEYLFIKFPLVMDNRDIVQEKKVRKEYNGNKNSYLSIAKSIEYPNIPPKKNIIRGEMILSAVYLREDNKGETKIFLINNVDFKITSMVDLVNKIAKKKPKLFIIIKNKIDKKYLIILINLLIIIILK